MKKMMRKWALLITVIVAVAGCAVAATLAAQTTDFTLMINGKIVETEKPIVVIDNSSYLPVRELSEKLGFDVTWHEKFAYRTNKVIDIRTNPMGEMREMVRDRVKLDLPEDTQTICYQYDGEWDHFAAKISVPHEAVEAMTVQLNKEYTETLEDGTIYPSTAEAIGSLPPYINNHYNWWDLDQDQIEYAYNKPVMGRYLEDGSRVLTVEIHVLILKEVDGRHLVYIKY